MPEKFQRLVIDLERNEKLAELVADLQPGDKIDATLSIVLRDDKKVTVEIDSVAEHSGSDDEESGDEAATDDAGDSADEADYSPAMKVAKGK